MFYASFKRHKFHSFKPANIICLLLSINVCMINLPKPPIESTTAYRYSVVVFNTVCLG